MDRPQQHALLLAVDPKSGATRTLLEESDPAWITSASWADAGASRSRSGSPTDGVLLGHRAQWWTRGRAPRRRRHAPRLVGEARAEDGRRLAATTPPSGRCTGWPARRRPISWRCAPGKAAPRSGWSPDCPSGWRQTLKLSADGATRIVTVETPTTLPTWTVYERDGPAKGELPLTRSTPLRPAGARVPEARAVRASGPTSFARRCEAGQKLPTIVYVYGGPHARWCAPARRIW